MPYMQKIAVIRSIPRSGVAISSSFAAYSDQFRISARHQRMRKRISAMLLAMVLLIGIPVQGSADYESGKRAWDAGRPAEALQHWQAAADSGDRHAMLELGRLYLQGLGAPQDYVLAHMWFNLAAARGEREALNEREALAAKMTPEQVATAQKMARERPLNALHRAVLAGDINGLKFALAAGADVNARDGSGLTALMHAANKGYVLMSEPLLAVPRLDIDARAPDGATALFIAAVHGHTEVIEQLLKAGADVSVAGPKGKTAVDVARSRYGDAGSDSARNEVPAIRALLQGISWAEHEKRLAKWKSFPVGNEYRDCDTCPLMVVVPSGTFMMGSPSSEEGRGSDEGPVHRVEIRERFAVGKYEVTFREWDACVAEGRCSHRPDDEGWGRGNRPVISVSWLDAKEYVNWLSRKTGGRYRLLSESEWEYVARAGTTGPFHFGSTISTDQANYDGNYKYGGGYIGIYREKTVLVGSFSENRFGLHDVHGNVWEWVEDCWHDSYDGEPSDGSAWISGGNCDLRRLRGGSWYNEPRVLSAANRIWIGTGDRYNKVGFRVARTLTP